MSMSLSLWTLGLRLGVRQRWATATLKISSLPLSLSLFAENKAALLLSLLNKNSSKLSLPLFATATFGELLKFVLFCRIRVYFLVSPWNVFKIINFVGCPFLNNHDLWTIVIEPFWLGIAHLTANPHITGT